MIYLIQRWNPATRTWDNVRRINGMPMMFTRKREALAEERKLRLCGPSAFTRVILARD